MKRWGAELQDQSAAMITSFLQSLSSCFVWAPAVAFRDSPAELLTCLGRALRKLKACHWKKVLSWKENRSGCCSRVFLTLRSDSSTSPMMKACSAPAITDENLVTFFFFTSFKCNYHHLREKKQSGVAREVLVFTTLPFYVPSLCWGINESPCNQSTFKGVVTILFIIDGAACIIHGNHGEQETSGWPYRWRENVHLMKEWKFRALADLNWPCY